MVISSSLLLLMVLAQAPAPKTPAAKTPAAATKTSPKTAATPAAAKPVISRPAGAKAVVPAKPKAMVGVPTTDDEKTIYAVGLSIYQSLNSFQFTEAELELVKRAITDAAQKHPAVELPEWGPKIQGLAQARQARGAEKEKAVSAAYLTKAAGELGAMKTESGMIYRQLTAGSGASPKASDTVKVHYRGTLVNGTEFDSSYKRNEPAQFGLSQVVPCWTEGVQKMKVGEKAMLVCPSSLAYGDNGRPGIPGGATLIFEIELLEIAGAKP